MNWLVMRNMVIAWFGTMSAAALAAWVIFRFTVLPDPWCAIVTGLFIVVLLTWAGSLMLRATTADDIEAELPGRETGSETTTGYGIHVSQVNDEGKETLHKHPETRSD